MTATLIVAAMVIIAFFLIITLIQNFLIVVPPNKVLVISGRSHQTPQGDQMGYRIIRGGRAFRIPLLEKVSWLDLTTMPLELTVQNAFSKGGIPLTIHAVANAKINAEEPKLGNAVERFLDMPRDQIIAIVRDTMEGNLRGVIATLTPEQINEDRLSFAESLIAEAQHDLDSLGIKLDTLKIQNVSDKAGYLESIGRKQTAEVLKEARVAEANREAEAAQAEAEAKQRSTIAKTAAEQAILERQTELRVRQAELEQEAKSRENQASANAERARVEAEQSLEEQRIILNQKRFEADTVAPARAQRDKAVLDAEASAAPIIEQGKARAKALAQLMDTIKQAGAEGRQAYVLQMLPELTKTMADGISGMNIDKISVIDSGNGQATQNAAQIMPRTLISMMEQLSTVTGVDVLGSMHDASSGQVRPVLSMPVVMPTVLDSASTDGTQGATTGQATQPSAQPASAQPASAQPASGPVTLSSSANETLSQISNQRTEQ